jgi:hypothetical protein
VVKHEADLRGLLMLSVTRRICSAAAGDRRSHATVTAVDVLLDHVLLLTFVDGRRGTYDFGGRLWGPVFALRESYAAFCTVPVASGMGTIVWPLGEHPSLWPDWAPEELYENRQPLPGGQAPAPAGSAPCRVLARRQAGPRTTMRRLHRLCHPSPPLS